MINKTIAFIGAALNSFLKEKLAITEDKVIVNRLVNNDGSSLPENANKLVVTFIHLEEESPSKSISTFSANKSEKGEKKDPHSIFLLLQANGQQYSESLALLDLTRQFLTTNSEFDRNSTHGFPPELNKLVIEPYPLTFEQQCNIYAMLGVKYQPSTFIKVRISMV